MTQEKSLIYGEVEFKSFYRVLRKINPTPGLVFYDLGSGTGKAVFAARLTQDFSKCIGIEILHSLHKQAEKILTRYQSDFESYLALGQDQRAGVFEGSFTDYDWSDGDVVFANSTCFDDNLMATLGKDAVSLKPGSIVVTFTKGIALEHDNLPVFELLERKRYKMSWGPATVFIHRRLKLDGKSLGEYKLNILPSDSITYDDDLTSTTSSGSHPTGPSNNQQPSSSSSNNVVKTSSPKNMTYEYDYIEDDEDDEDNDNDNENDNEEEEEDDSSDDDDDNYDEEQLLSYLEKRNNRFLDGDDDEDEDDEDNEYLDDLELPKPPSHPTAASSDPIKTSPAIVPIPVGTKGASSTSPAVNTSKPNTPNSTASSSNNSNSKTTTPNRLFENTSKASPSSALKFPSPKLVPTPKVLISI